MTRLESGSRKTRFGNVLATLLLGAASVSMAADRTMSDVNIRDAVEDELLFDASVPLNRIDVSTADGIVTLTGTVNSMLAKERAARIARAVKGVESVVNQVEVKPTDARADEAIRDDVQTSLAMDPATESYELDVEVANGHVTLHGTVDSWQEKELAAKVAKSVSGVTGLENALEVTYHATRTDHEIESEIEKALEWDVLVDDGLIDLTVDNGNVTLSGIVGSAAEKNRAVADVWVTGVKDVDSSELQVARWARDDELRKHKYVARADTEIRGSVEGALARDPRANSFDINTRVSNGIATLRGTVDNLKAKRAAEQDARNTVGVYRVVNRIKVRPAEMLTDAEVESRVREALIRDSIVESYEVDVGVHDGEVRLDGEVDSYFEQFHADDVASRVEGVEVVDNNLAVDHDEPAAVYDPYVDPYYYPYGYSWYYDSPSRTTIRSDAEIKEDVEDELFWSPFVDSDDVYVSVDDGVVTLTGTVDSWTESRSAIENAYEGGALSVDNELVVSPTS